MLLRFLVVVVSLMALPAAAAAKDHYVIITGFGFFPQVSYVKPGDTVYFKNESWIEQKLSGGQNSNNPWSLDVDPDAVVSMKVTGLTDSTYSSLTAPLMPALLSFADPPPEAIAE